MHPSNSVSPRRGRFWQLSSTLAAVTVLGICLAPPTQARPQRDLITGAPALGLGEPVDDRPPAAFRSGELRAFSDTISFGNVDEDGFAVRDDVWSFDHGGADPLEGISALDETEQTGTYGRHITDAIWTSDPDNGVDAPVLRGDGSAWIGAFQGEADDLCWEGGLGYGNSWCQRIVSPTLSRQVGSSVQLDWTHFNDTEAGYDYTRVFVELLPGGDRLELTAYTGPIGLAGTHPADPPVGAVDGATLADADFLGSTDFRIVFEMASDGGWSDEDDMAPTEYGPAGFDDVLATELPDELVLGNYGFETDLDGWTAEACPELGSHLGVARLSDYVIEDACNCALSGSVIELHDPNREHPQGQHVMVVAPPVDVLNDVAPFFSGDPARVEIFVDWDQYSILPRANGVLFRTGAFYYPFVCDLTNEVGWSPRVGEGPFHFTGSAPNCATYRSSLTDVDANGTPVPRDAEQIRYVYELLSSCAFFAIPETECTDDETNFAPLLDNIRIRFTETPVAPGIAFGLGGQFQDGFAQGTLVNDPSKPGRADCTAAASLPGNVLPIALGDSLSIAGPLVLADGSNSWEAHLWFRVARKGPLAGASYELWRDDVNGANGVDIEAGQFAVASMDSVQLGTNAFKHKFCSYLKEEDWAAWGRSGPELSDDTEIIQDDVLYPGTRIEYFVTANYMSGNGDRFLLPDTVGGFFNEFEILPGWRDLGGGVLGYPCLLYVDAYNRGAEYYIEHALDQAGIAHDRYDYLDACSCWNAPMARGTDGVSNNGCTIHQLLGYRGVFVNMGATEVTGVMYPEDYELFSDWLTADACPGGRRGLIFNGTGAPTILEESAPTLAARMGITLLATDYSALSGDEGSCVELEVPSGGGAAYGTSHSGGVYDYDAFGNGCPTELRFDVLGPVGTGVGNRIYVAADGGTETAYAQVVNEGTGPNEYRTVIDGTSWHRLVDRDPLGECVTPESAIINAAANEIQAAAEWIYGIGNVPSVCEDPCDPIPTGTPGPGGTFRASTRLEASAPNPFHPRTTLRYSLAADGPATLAVFDVSGRRVRTLVSEPQSAGVHEIVWDGTDEKGAPLASGTYWARLETDLYRGASRMILLK